MNFVECIEPAMSIKFFALEAVEALVPTAQDRHPLYAAER